jgi:predicted esterase
MPRTAVVLLTLAALAISPQPGSAQEASTDDRAPVVLLHDAKVLLPTQVFLPPGFDPEREYTLIVGLHGYGASASGFGRTGRALADMGFLVALPESAYSLLADDALGFQWFPSREGDENAERVAQLLFFDHMPSVFADLKARYSIEEVYTLGFSEGAVASLGTAIYNPKDCAGAIQFGLPLFSADWSTEQELTAGRNVRLLFLHGQEDKRVPPSISDEAYNFFLEAGYEAALHVFDGGHTVPRDQLDVVADWIRQ